MAHDTGWLDRLFDTFAANSARLLKQDGIVHPIVWGVDPRGIRCAILQGATNDEPSQLDGHEQPTVLLPAPLQQWQPTIRQLFGQVGANAAIWVGESWLFPDSEDGQAAAQAFYAGNGIRPSEHPDRQEAVFTMVVSPLRGYHRFDAWNIVRRPHRPPQVGDSIIARRGTGGSDPLEWSSTWLEECLPAPDDPDQYTHR